MPPVTFIDASVPIYLAGREHAYREPCILVLATVNDKSEAFVTDGEVGSGTGSGESFAAMMSPRRDSWPMSTVA